MTLETIRATLAEATGVPFALFAWDPRPRPPYGLVSLDGSAASFWGDGASGEQAALASCDIFVRGDPAELAASVERALASLPRLSWRLNSVQYESDTKLVHMEWALEFFREAE